MSDDFASAELAVTKVLEHSGIKDMHWGEWNEETRKRRMREAGLLPRKRKPKDVEQEKKEPLISSPWKGMRWGPKYAEQKASEAQNRKEKRKAFVEKLKSVLPGKKAEAMSDADKKKLEEKSSFLAKMAAGKEKKKQERESEAQQETKQESSNRQSDTDNGEKQNKVTPESLASAKAVLNASGFKDWEDFNRARIEGRYSRDGKTIQRDMGAMSTEDIKSRTNRLQAERLLKEEIAKIPPTRKERMKQALKQKVKSTASAAVKSAVAQGLVGVGLVNAGLSADNAYKAQALIQSTAAFLTTPPAQIKISPNPGAGYKEALTAIEEARRQRRNAAQ